MCHYINTPFFGGQGNSFLLSFVPHHSSDFIGTNDPKYWPWIKYHNDWPSMAAFHLLLTERHLPLAAMAFSKFQYPGCFTGTEV